MVAKFPLRVQNWRTALAALIYEFCAAQDAEEILLQNMRKIATGSAQPVAICSFIFADHGHFSGSTRAIIYYNACEIPRAGLQRGVIKIR